ncbi:MAG: M23 family metallopeptidase [Burkholderiaceae bacterium]
MHGFQAVAGILTGLVARQRSNRLHRRRHIAFYLAPAVSVILVGCAGNGGDQSFRARLDAISEQINATLAPLAERASTAAAPYTNSLAASLGNAQQRMQKYVADSKLFKDNKDSGNLSNNSVINVLSRAGVSTKSNDADRVGADEPAPELRPGSDTSDWRWPVDAGIITSKFGARWGKQHRGMDIAGAIGEPIIAVADGEVIYSDNKMRGYGNVIVVKHANDMTTLYAHNDKLVSKRGDRVVKGTVIAYLGNTGRSTGPHTHFEIRQGKVALDPVAVLPTAPLPYAFVDPDRDSLFARADGAFHRYEDDQGHATPPELDQLLDEVLLGSTDSNPEPCYAAASKKIAGGLCAAQGG